MRLLHRGVERSDGGEIDNSGKYDLKVSAKMFRQ